MGRYLPIAVVDRCVWQAVGPEKMATRVLLFTAIAANLALASLHLDKIRAAGFAGSGAVHSA